MFHDLFPIPVQMRLLVVNWGWELVWAIQIMRIKRRELAVVTENNLIERVV